MESFEQKCILCGSTKYDNFYKLNSYSLVRCSSCSLIRVSPTHDEQEREKISQSIYSSSDYRERYFKDKRFFKRWFNAKLKIIERHKQEKGKILDIGCSYGFCLEVAEKRGWDVYGIEINPITGGYAKDKFGDKVFIGKIENSCFETDSFDVIALWDVVEHVVDPVKFLQTMKRYLKQSGIICIQVPNIDSYISKIKNKNWDWLTPGDHLYFFSPETLLMTLKTADLKSVYLDTWEPNCYFIDSLIGFNEINNFLFELYRKTVVRIFRKLLFFIFIPFQWIIKKKNKGALIVTFCAIRN
jgi:SAM-dependent methyltransferase